MRSSASPLHRSSSQCTYGFRQHRVLIYTSCYNVIDGVTLTIRKLEHEILAAGHHVCILTTLSGDSKNTDLDGCHPNRQVIFMDNAYSIPFLNDPKHPELTYQVGLAISSNVKRKLDEFEPSILHITVPDCTALHLVKYARTKEIPIVGTYHSNIPEYLDHYPGVSFLKHLLAGFFRHQYNFYQALYVPTPYIVKHLVDSYKIDACTALHIWGRGVDVSVFSPSHRSWKFRQSLGIADDVCVILWVGRLVPEKRPDIFAEVIRRLNEKNVRYHALIVGNGACEKEICDIPNSTFLGWMNTEQLSVVYASSDVFLFPSGVETFGNVTLEAASSGLPIVVEEGCSGHLVVEGKNGFAVEEGDVDAFFKATLVLVKDKSLRERFGAAGREFALTLEKSSVVREMLTNYEKITDEFYIEYGGHHANRDSAYSHEGSFISGRHPRPFILFLAESAVILLFRVMWSMAVMFNMLLESMHHRQHDSIRADRYLESTKSVTVSSSLSTSENTESQHNISVDDEDGNVVDLNDIEYCEPSRKYFDQNDDEATVSTKASCESSSQVQGRTMAAPGDWQISHSAAIAFVKTVQYQCLLESKFRTFLSHRSSQLLQGMFRRRKDSSDDFDFPDTFEVKGNRQKVDDGKLRSTSTRDLLQPPASFGLQESKVLRRNQYISVDSSRIV